MNEPPSLALSRRWGNLRWIRQVGPHEWHSECPVCFDSGHAGNDWPDRFFMRDDGKPRGFCRKCGFQDFADSDKHIKITDEERQLWIKERLEREQQAKRTAERALDLLRKEHQWEQWHTNMTQTGLNFWYSKGVPDWAIDYYELGYCQSKTIWYHDAEYITPTATIPVFSPGRKLINVRHRLINPPEPNDKYRPDRAGIPSALYLADPDRMPQGECILVEGEIKTIVVATQLDTQRFCIVGIPGKRPRQDLLDQLKDCGRIHVVLDPDATQQAFEIARQLGNRARVVQMTVKPDDMFTMYGAEPQDFYAALRYGRIVQ